MTRTATRKGMTLRDALAEFIKHPTPWMLLAWSSALIIGRIILGSWSIADAIVPIALVAISPIAEWLIHVGILHWRPVRSDR